MTVATRCSACERPILFETSDAHAEYLEHGEICRDCRNAECRDVGHLMRASRIANASGTLWCCWRKRCGHTEMRPMKESTAVGTVTVYCRGECGASITGPITDELTMRDVLSAWGWSPAENFELRFTDGPAKPIYCSTCRSGPS